MKIKLDDLTDPRIKVFLKEHLEDMRSVSPPKSKHALDLVGLKSLNVRFYSVWIKDELIGCGAYQKLGSQRGEIKSMRVTQAYRAQGIASKLLRHILTEAKNEGLKQISLETGSMDFFKPARSLYERFGFTYCSAFANYQEDPNSMFMTFYLADD